MSGVRGAVVAFADESGSSALRDPDTYLMAAVLIPDSQHDEARAIMSSLKHRGERKLHWYDENETTRSRIAETIGAMSLPSIVVVRSQTGEREERKRRKCLEQLLVSLDDAGVVQLNLESRGKQQDDRDMGLVQVLRSQKVLSGELRVDHLPGPTEPLLWIADSICGAYVSLRIGEQSHWQHVEQTSTILDVQI